MTKKTVNTKHKEILNMDKELLLSKSPIIYTRKLDDMTIFKKDLSKIQPKDIIESIISESKPLCLKSISRIDNKKMCKEKYDIHANNSPIKLINSKFEKLQSILKEIKTKNCGTNSALVAKSEVKSDTCSRNNIESRLAMCKPLKIVLEDINKIVPIPKGKEDIELINISSDSDDDVITIGKEKIVNKSDANTENFTSTGISVTSPITNHMIESVSDLQKVLLAKELRKCCIVIYNLNVKKLESYQIGENYNVVGYKSQKYTKIIKFPIKRCKFVINVIACCWNKRQSIISLLLQLKKYCDIGRFISNSHHSCRKNCKCCCNYVEQFSAEVQGDNEAGNSARNTTDSLLDNSSTSPMGKSKLITAAMTFQANKKWKFYPDVSCKLNDKNKQNKCCKRLLKFTNTQGEVEFYELGREDVIYSKVVNSTDDESSWLFKTVNQSRYYTNLTFTNPDDREKKTIYKRLNNALPFHTKCFLRNPLKIEAKKKSKNRSYNSPAIRYEIEHTKSLVSSKGLEALSILPEVRRTDFQLQPPKAKLTKPSPVSSLPAPKTPKNPQTVLPAVMDEEVAQNINSLIKDILHRFRDVFLTINSEGRVSAALNAPLKSLSTTELKILSEILTHAQSQVDKLGLSPGTCITPLGIPSTSENSTSTTNASNSEPNNKKTKQTCPTNKKQTLTVNKSINKPTKTYSKKKQTYTHKPSADSKNQNPNGQKTQSGETNFLHNSPVLIARKKYSYRQSFCNYLGEKLEAAPKITDLFSSKNVNCTSSNILKNLLEGRNLMPVNNGSVSNNVDANKVDEPILLDKETQTIRPNKRKTDVEDNGTLAKIRIKTAAEILVENSSSLSSLSPPVVILHSSPLVQANTTPSPAFIADHNYVITNNVQLNVSNISDSLPTMKFP